MDAIAPEQLVEMERRAVARLVGEFNIDWSGLVVDMTNFATYIDSGNGRAPIAQQGHAKQKRTDLRLVSLGLVVATDGGIPLTPTPMPATAMMSSSSRSWWRSCASASEPSVGTMLGSLWSMTPEVALLH